MRRILIAGLLIACTFVHPRPAVCAPYTDEDIVKYFRKNKQATTAHRVMTAERRRLHDILDGILMGDLESVAVAAGDMADAMRAMTIETSLSSEEEVLVWKYLSEVVLQASMIRSAAEKMDYRKAYEHYTVLTSQCVQCHQIARSWGKFEEPEIPEEPAPKAAA